MTNQKLLSLLDTLDYSPAPEKTGDKALEWIKSHNNTFGHFIGGHFTVTEKTKKFKVFNPATGKVLARVVHGNKKDVDDAMHSAETAFPNWSKRPAYERQKYLYAIARAINRHERLFAALESLNNGKPIREARIDVALVIRHFYHHAGWAPVAESRFSNHEPGGGVGAIIPWNFPLLMLAWKIAPAIAVGNTIVIKPAETTPLTAMLFAEILKDAGLPVGVVNIVNGAGETGSMIVGHPTPWKIAFTGSTEVAKKIREATAGSGKHITLEAGGKSPQIVFADADLDAAVDGVRDGIFFNQGHVCCASSRLLVQESIAKQFIRKLRKMMGGLRIGDPLDKNTDVGAINSKAQLTTINSYLEIAKKEGKVWQPLCYVPENGYWCKPTLITNIHPTAKCTQEEIFGPVLVVQTFRTPSEAVRLANNTRYGLAASVWTEDPNKLGYIATRIKAGTIWLNCTNQFDANSGFGGYRESGYGREGGEEGILEYLQEKRVSTPRSVKCVDRAVPCEALDSAVINKVDQTYRFLVGGKLARPDGGSSFQLKSHDNKPLADIGDGNRKDVRNAVRAARKAYPTWSGRTAHNRAQILYFLAENLSSHVKRFARDIHEQTGRSLECAAYEVEKSLERLFLAAGMADKFEGRVHSVNDPNMKVDALKEPIGVIGIRASNKHPLLSLVSVIGPAIAMGNTVVVISGRHALTAMDFIRVIQNSDVPPGVINVLASYDPDARAKEMAEHEDVDSIWYFGNLEGCEAVEKASICNMKRTFTDKFDSIDWIGMDCEQIKFFREATQIKNIWTPYGVELTPTL